MSVVHLHGPPGTGFCPTDSSPSPAPGSDRLSPAKGQYPANFVALVEPHLPDLIASARRILGSEDLAWDAVQESLQRIWVRGWLPEDCGAALAYLVRKSSLHLRRCQSRRSDHEYRFAASSGRSCCEEDPLAILENADQVRQIREAIRGISAEYRAVLEMYEVEGESYEGIARRLGLPVGTVRSRLSRARKQLREILGDSFFAA